MKRVLIVDDSAIFRRQISAALASAAEFTVAGIAPNGKVALQMLLDQKADIAVVDLEMPEMNGLELLEELGRRKIAVTVILFASATKSSALSSIQALNRGAFDFVLKPTGGGNPADLIRQVLLPKLEAASIERRVPTTPGLERFKASGPAPLKFPGLKLESFSPEALVIGSSTGGPRALEILFTKLGPELNIPIFIAQHMPPIFTVALAERLTTISGMKAQEATHMEPIQAGRVYVAPGDFHMRVMRVENIPTIVLDQTAQRHSVRPAIDHLFESATLVYGRNLMGVVLTGMGEDGRDGAVAIKKAGGAMIIQNEASCVVYGMPRAVHESGAFDVETDLTGVRQHLERVIKPAARALGRVP